MRNMMDLRFAVKVWVVALLSSFLCLSAAQSHELVATIADFEAADGQFTMHLSGAMEPLVAGIDLDGLVNTDDADDGAEMDRLRALPPAEMAVAIANGWPRLAERLSVTVDGEPLTLTLDDVAVDPVGDVEFARSSVLRLSGTLPEGAQSIEVAWPKELGSLVLRQEGVEEPFTGYLTGGEPSGLINLDGTKTTAWGAFFSYIPVGFDHILPLGLDHILFVLGLFFLAPRLGPLLWQVTAFTAAHTITLALAALGWVSVPGSVVEPLIALSIAYVALENIWAGELKPWRPLVVFGFGLLHGLGFASVLADFGLPEAQFIPALLGFNIGVELGQLTVIAAAFVLTWVALRYDRALIERAPAIGIAAVVLAVTALGLFLTGDLRMLAVTAVVLAGLSAASVLSYASYRSAVAIPASLIIAAVGLWWAYERVFL